MAQNENSVDSSNDDIRRVSLALGGGGARGISHLGVLQAVTEHGFRINHICGISIGAIAGAMYATGEPIESVQSKTLEFIHSPEFRRRRSQMFGLTPAQGYHGNGWMQRFRKMLSAPKSVTRALRSNAILPESVLRQVVESLLPDVAIEDLAVPFSVVAVDVLSGQRVEIEEGSLRDAVRASASIPGVFPPVEWDGKLLCDIGVFETVPAVTAKNRADDLTVAVDVSDHIIKIEGCNNILEIMTRMQHLAENQLRKHSLVHADVVVRPDIGRRAWFDFNEPEQLIELGRMAASDSLSTYASQPTPSTISIPITSMATQSSCVAARSGSE
ncbi:MAG: patatin-like phospholipase family protein [Planctomycetota bacterium]